MTQPSGLVNFSGALVFLVSVFFLASLRVAAQQPSSNPQEEEETRMLWNTTFQKKRPPAKESSSAPAGGAAPQSQKPVPAEKAPPAAATDEIGDALIGVTIWRLRESAANDDPAVRIGSRAGGEQWTPIRVEADTSWSEGQKVRVSFEAARAGYLYVIDREQYADGTFGDPYLIFPTFETHRGNNEVRAGRSIEIPAWDDNPPYFTLEANRPDQVAEVLTVIVSPEPLPEVKIGRDPLRLSPDQVRVWEQKWGVTAKRLEARGQAGKPYTKAEKEAGREQTRLLADEEPLPQTMYRLDAEPGAPLLISIPLKIAR